MFSSLPGWMRNFLPAKTAVNYAERFRSCAGALLGILLTGALSVTILGPTSTAIWLIAPMGASAVLLFAVPASPMAQPRRDTEAGQAAEYVASLEFFI